MQNLVGHRSTVVKMVLPKSVFIGVVLSLSFNLSYSQSKSKLDSLLISLWKIDNSKNIISQPQAKEIIQYGEKVLPVLAAYFSDSTQTRIQSECQNLYLTKGEVAIILADRIELMPYAVLTGIQNCTLEFCKNTPNLIEYYLSAIRRDGVTSFQTKYVKWLASIDRKEWSPYLNNKKRKNIW